MPSEVTFPTADKPVLPQLDRVPKKDHYIKVQSLNFRQVGRVFSKIAYFLERILMEHIEMVCSLEFELFFISICSIRIRSRKRDIFKIPHQLNSNPSENVPKADPSTALPWPANEPS